MNHKKVLQIGTDLFYETISSILIAIAVHNFALAAQFPMTGFSGIAIILNRFFRLPIGLSTLLLNIPVALLCYRRIGRSFLIKSFRCMTISSIFIDFLAPIFPFYEGPRLLAALVTGVVGGLGYAIIYTRGSSTGGADFLIMALKSMKPHLRLGTIAFSIDVGIIIAGGLLFRDFDGVIYGMLVNYTEFPGWIPSGRKGNRYGSQQFQTNVPHPAAGHGTRQRGLHHPVGGA